MNNYNKKDLFSRDIDSADILNNRTIEDDSINTWDDFFEGFFGAPLERPKQVQVMMRRSLPPGHPNNPIDIQLHIPYMFGMDDAYGERWMGYIFDTSTDEVGWRYLLIKPDRDVYLAYLRGDLDLISVYETVDTFYVCAPDMSPDLMEIDPSELPPSAIPIDDSYYSTDIWFDPDDHHFGMNVAHTKFIMEKANENQFY